LQKRASICALRSRADHAQRPGLSAAFYEGPGFAATSSPYDDFGVPHIDMMRLAEY